MSTNCENKVYCTTYIQKTSILSRKLRCQLHWVGSGWSVGW